MVSLNLSHNDLEGIHAVEALNSFLDSSSSLVMLNLSENRIGDDGIELLSKAFNEGKSRLQKLNLSSVGGSAQGFKTLFKALKLNQWLRELTLDGNDFKSKPRYTREDLLKQQNYYNYSLP
jgi:Ran GTPase-activating protein (RanGAP) involved in mRNA processing and transport